MRIRYSKGAKELMLMMSGLHDSIYQLAMTNIVHW